MDFGIGARISRNISIVPAELSLRMVYYKVSLKYDSSNYLLLSEENYLSRQHGDRWEFTGIYADERLWDLMIY